MKETIEPTTSHPSRLLRLIRTALALTDAKRPEKAEFKARGLNISTFCAVVAASSGATKIDTPTRLKAAYEYAQLVDKAELQCANATVGTRAPLLRSQFDVVAPRLRELGFGTALSTVKEQIQPAHLVILETCAHTLEELAIEPCLSRKDSSALLDSLTKIEAAVASSDLPAELRFKILARLAEVRAAIQAFDIFGVDAIEDAIDAATGMVGRVESNGRFETSEVFKLWIAFVGQWSRLGLSGLLIANRILELRERVMKMLGGPHEGG
jgi:hypothetical protein